MPIEMPGVVGKGPQGSPVGWRFFSCAILASSGTGSVIGRHSIRDALPIYSFSYFGACTVDQLGFRVVEAVVIVGVLLCGRRCWSRERSVNTTQACGRISLGLA